MFQASTRLGLLLMPLEVIVVQNGWKYSPSIDEETLNHCIPVARIHSHSVYMTVRGFSAVSMVSAYTVPLIVSSLQDAFLFRLTCAFNQACSFQCKTATIM